MAQYGVSSIQYATNQMASASGEKAFYGCKNLNSVILTDTLSNQSGKLKFSFSFKVHSDLLSNEDYYTSVFNIGDGMSVSIKKTTNR